MKTKIVFLILWIYGLNVVAQSTTSTQVDVTVYTLEYKTCKEKSNDYLTKNKLKINSQNVGKDNYSVNFNCTSNQYEEFEKLFENIGYISSKRSNTVNNEKRINEIQLEIDYLKKNKDAYEELLKKVNEGSDRYFNLWNELKQTNAQIFNLEKEIIRLTGDSESITVNFQLFEESTTPESSRVTFVNMPGAEYSILQIESPKNGISNAMYQGYFIKYLFTKGKSYATVGNYKSLTSNKNDVHTFSEMFMLGFGQDFYSRHLGRGTRKYLNLYSGYSVGDVYCTGTKSNLNAVYLAPSIGLELYKNKYFLIDTKVNYFIPITSNNRNMRGLSYNLSLNFVF